MDDYIWIENSEGLLLELYICLEEWRNLVGGLRT